MSGKCRLNSTMPDSSPPSKARRMGFGGLFVDGEHEQRLVMHLTFGKLYTATLRQASRMAVNGLASVAITQWQHPEMVPV